MALGFILLGDWVKVLTSTDQGEAVVSIARRAVATTQEQLVHRLDVQERDELNQLLEKAVLTATEQKPASVPF